MPAGRDFPLASVRARVPSQLGLNIIREDFMILLWIGIGLVGLVALMFLLISCRDATYCKTGLLPPKDQATMADVERLARAGQRLAAIRCDREIHDVSLVEAKRAVEALPVNP